MRKLYWMAAAAGALAAGGAHAQGYGYEGGYLPPPAYAYDSAPVEDTGCGDRFTIAGVHAGVTVLGVDVGGGVAASVGGYCEHHYHHRRVEYAQPAYAPPPVYQQPAYPQPYQQRYSYAPPQQPVYAPPPPMPWQGGQQGYVSPCGCGEPQGW